MSECVLIIRPQPGAGETAARAIEMGMDSVQYPLFRAETLAWRAPPPDKFDAVMLTSANTLLHGGASLEAYRDLPSFAVGEATAKAAQRFGFANVVTAGPDAQATAQTISNAGHHRIFHPGGQTVRDFDAGALSVTHAPVYQMAAAGDHEGVDRALKHAQIILVHSPRAGERVAALASPGSKMVADIVAISAATAAACGSGWKSIHIASAASDSAMLAMALQICHNRAE